jgi:hypothetical protein
MLLGFAVGIAVGKASKPEIQPLQPATRAISKEKDREKARLLASLDEFRNALIEKEQIAASLRAEIEEVRGKLLPPLSAEDEKWLKERQEDDKRIQRWKRVSERKKELMTKICQRKDKVLRAEGLDDMASLLDSDAADDVLVGIETLKDLLLGGHRRFEMERFKPPVLAALTHEDWEIRQQALEYWRLRYFGEEAAGIALGMVNDPNARVEHEAFYCLWSSGAMERNENIAQSLRGLLLDEDKQNRTEALWHISNLARAPCYGPEQPQRGYDYYGELEDLVMELSRGADSAQDVLEFWWRREALSEEALGRAAEILAATDPDEHFELLHRDPVSPEMRELACRHYFRVVRESLDSGGRLDALWWLQRTGDKSLIPELEALAGSDEAEGIKSQLEEAIRHLELYGRK